MTFTQAIRTCFAKYFTFSGRATRPEYWWFFLFLFLGGIVCGFFDGFLFGAGTYETEITENSLKATANANGPLATIFNLGTIIPMLAAGWRRMHDTGRSGLYLLYPFIAFAGTIAFVGMIGGFETLGAGDVGGLMTGGLGIIVVGALIICAISPLIVLFWLTRPTQTGENQYGPNPNEVTP